MGVFQEIIKFGEHEEVLFCHDPAVGLKAIIALHNTALGPALGGTRMWNYASEEEALVDVTTIYPNRVGGYASHRVLTLEGDQWVLKSRYDFFFWD